MKGPRIYKAINSVMAELANAGISKIHSNAQEQYKYRSIDDVLNRLAPLLAKHRLCVLPRVIDRIAVDRRGRNDELLTGVTLRVAFDLISTIDESRCTVETYGEALDGGDKATSKAMSSAYKVAMLQTFCVPVTGTEDPDALTHRLRQPRHEPPPAQGWEQWVKDIEHLIAGCLSEEALERVREAHRAGLNSISKERSDLYHRLGEAFRTRVETFNSAVECSTVSPPTVRRSRNERPKTRLEPVDA